MVAYDPQIRCTDMHDGTIICKYIPATRACMCRLTLEEAFFLHHVLGCLRVKVALGGQQQQQQQQAPQQQQDNADVEMTEAEGAAPERVCTKELDAEVRYGIVGVGVGMGERVGVRLAGRGSMWG